jgi:hypothetical protein
MRAAVLRGLAARGHEQAADPWAISTGFRVSNIFLLPPAAKDESFFFLVRKVLMVYVGKILPGGTAKGRRHC